MNLAVILSNRCSLLCRYCPVLLNEGPARYLEAAQLRRGLDRYLDGAPGKQAVTYLGGEPLLKLGVVRGAIEHVRRRAPQCRQYLYTNGLLLTPAVFDFLESRGVGVIVSFDGRRRDNDRFRVVYGDAKRSSWQAVMARLTELPARRLGVHMVFTPETVAGLADNLEFLRAAGFGRIECSPDVSDVRRVKAWGPGPLRLLRARVAALHERLGSLEASEASRFEFAPPRRKLGLDFESIVLGADGRFYPCETVLNWPYEELASLSLGSVRLGIDWKKQKALGAEARQYVSATLPSAAFLSCPLKVYIHARRAAEDPEPLIRGTMAVFEALYAPAKSPGARERARSK